DQLAHVGRVSALGELAASLAHELDQPLGAILNNAETARILLAKKKLVTAELGAILDDIVADDRRAGEVLDRIRAMVQKQSFRPSAVDVPELLRDVVNLVQIVAAKKQIRLETSCEPGLSFVDGDRVLLQQALLNLVLNSIDAIGDRADGLISLRAGEAEAGRVGISFNDNGGGVPTEEAEQLLQPFHTTKEGGLGMGLPIVNSIVEQHGGALRLDNQPGRGLSVVLLLPSWEGEAGG
ncbi:MAG: sensor histidine kinase, partial [Chthoniobacterales bacterium]